MTKYQKVSSLAGLRRQARDAVQEAREKASVQQIKVAVDHYIAYNIRLRQPGVGYRYVPSKFRVVRRDLQEGVEARFDPYKGDDEDCDGREKEKRSDVEIG